MKRLARATVAAVTILGLGVPGIVGAASNIGGTTGPDSTNVVKTSSTNSWNTDNDNIVSASAHADQDAKSGSAKAYDNTTAGDAGSGNATNGNTVSATVNVDNSSSMPTGSMSGASDMGGTINGTTGPDSVNRIIETSKNTVKVDNYNHVSVSNSVDQDAKSGDASVTHNTTGGSATTGAASNTSSSTFDLSVTN